jgi:hypothetical protein
MARQATTRLYVSGYRFLLRRVEHALVRSDVRMLDDPRRAQSLSLIAGVVLAVIVVAACVVLAFVHSSGTLGSAPIVMVRETGALYVRVVTPCICAQSRLRSTDRRHRRTPKPWARRRSTLPNVVRCWASRVRPQRFPCRSATPNRAGRSATMRRVPLSSPAPQRAARWS